MPTRDARIAVSQSEKEQLDQVAEEAIGDNSVAYGAIISLLADNYLADTDDN